MKKRETGQGAVEFVVIAVPIAIVLIAVYLLLMPLIQQIQATLPPVTIPDYTSHTMDRHSDVASNAVNCFGGGGTINAQSLYNPDTGRSAWTCQDLLGKMFVWILDKDGNTITMFQNKSNTFDQVMQYLFNRGYLP